MEKVAIFTFQGELTCFGHALLNAVEMKDKGYDVKLVIEGAATRLLPELASPKNPFAKLFKRCVEEKILDCVCQACAGKMATLPYAEDQGFPMCAELKGHPSMSRYIDDGFQIISL